MTEPPPNETCEACVFDAARWTRQDAIRTVDNAAGLVTYATEGLAREHWNVRVRPDVWSIGEYVDHIREVIELNRIGCELGVADPGMTAPELGQPALSRDIFVHDPAVLMAALSEQANKAATFFEGLNGDEWDTGMVVQGNLWPPAYAITHICHDLLHHLDDIATIRTDLGDSVGPLTGSVSQINASGGGVPKTAVAVGHIGLAGLEGDRQATRRHHGRPWQAVCLYSTEVIDALAGEGHPIVPGASGENLTLTGIDWAALRAGLLVDIGAVQLRLSAPAAPCAKNSQWFSDRDQMRIAHERHPGFSRWYASVIRGGTINPGDAVTVISAAG